MRAIIVTGGKQFAVAPEDTIRVPTLAGEAGETVTFDRVLYVSDPAAEDGGVKVGAPAVDGATVTGEIVKHGRAKKIIVFKFKRRKRYRKTQGHRQNFTEVRITDVSVPAEKKKRSRREPAAGEDSSDGA